MGGRRQSVYEFAKKSNQKIKKKKLKKNSNMPLRQDMNTTILKNIDIKKTNENF